MGQAQAGSVTFFYSQAQSKYADGCKHYVFSQW